jgi:hypothetical protein
MVNTLQITIPKEKPFPLRRVLSQNLLYVDNIDPILAGLSFEVKSKFDDLDASQRGGLYKIEVFCLLEDMFLDYPEHGEMVKREFELGWDYDLIVRT